MTTYGNLGRHLASRWFSNSQKARIGMHANKVVKKTCTPNAMMMNIEALIARRTFGMGKIRRYCTKILILVKVRLMHCKIIVAKRNFQC